MPNQPVVSSTYQQPQKQQQSPQHQQQTKTTQLDILRSQVREVTNIMKDNVDEISKRGEKLEELETRSGRLEDLVKAFMDLQYFIFHICKKTVTVWYWFLG